jgi:subtilisin family serine protease
MISTVMRVQQEELRRFFQENPKTIFVVAAGNDGVDVARPGDFHSAAVSGPNVVNVAATDFNGRLAEFSNVSRQEIEIAAPGVVVRSALAGAGESRTRIAMSGTSMATPIVTNRLVQILAENPGMDAQEAIRVLLEQHTGILPELERSVAGGRWMLPRGLVGSASGTIESVEGVTQESYMDADACRRALEVSPDGHSIRPAPAPGSGGSVVRLVPRERSGVDRGDLIAA